MILIIIVLFIRLVNPRELDDVHPDIPCEEDFFKRASILWVIPNYNDTSVAVNRQWCAKILALNKTIGMHGINHRYNEFASPIDIEAFEKSLRIFEQCFGVKPLFFKPPQIAITPENEEIIRIYGMHVRGIFHQQMHKVYHCSDTGRMPNWLVKWI